MPNTIAHFALNGLIAQRFSRSEDLKWMFLACVIPDFPWICQRIVNTLFVDADPLALRAYFAIQASFVFCLLLSAFFALQVRRWRVVFSILSIGSLVHLLLDATQIKWGNGVHLFAPWHWQSLQFNWYWPESFYTYLLTLTGLVYYVYRFRDATSPGNGEFQASYGSRALSMGFLLAWLLLPFYYLPDAFAEDVHYVSTWKHAGSRSGKVIEIDREPLTDSQSISAPDGDSVALSQAVGDEGSTVSIRGQFLSSDFILVHDQHVHSPWRDYTSIFGVLGVLVIWAGYFIRSCFSR